MLSRRRKWIVIVVVILALLSLSWSCTKIRESEWGKPGKGNVAFETLPATDSVPLNWGKLVSVSSSPNLPYAFQLWFQDEQGNLRMVLFDMHANILWKDARFIPRK